MACFDCQKEWHPSGKDRSRPVGESKGIPETRVSKAGGLDRRLAGFIFPEGFFSQMKGIADTGFLVAFAARRDRYHDWAVDLAKQISEPLLTCEAVLAETAFHLQDTGLALSLVREKLVRPAFNLADQLPYLEELAQHYADRQPDLADLCLIRLSELYRRHKVITVDAADFRVYRRNRNESIPLIVPPDLD